MSRFRGVRTDEGYAVWRSSIPFTDAQIADALELAANEMERPYLAQRYHRYAELARKGRVTSGAISVALHSLIRRCQICGQVALYRVGSYGRCRAHRSVSDSYHCDREAGREMRAVEREQDAATRRKINVERFRAYKDGLR